MSKLSKLSKYVILVVSTSLIYGLLFFIGTCCGVFVTNQQGQISVGAGATVIAIGITMFLVGVTHLILTFKIWANTKAPDFTIRQPAQ